MSTVCYRVSCIAYFFSLDKTHFRILIGCFFFSSQFIQVSVYFLPLFYSKPAFSTLVVLLYNLTELMIAWALGALNCFHCNPWYNDVQVHRAFWIFIYIVGDFPGLPFSVSFLLVNLKLRKRNLNGLFTFKYNLIYLQKSLCPAKYRAFFFSISVILTYKFIVTH